MANSAFGKHTDKPQSVYNVTFGKASKRLTVFCGFVFAAVTVLCVVTSPGGIANFIAPVALLLCVIVCYGYFPRRIEVAADALTVRRGIGSRKISLSTIVSAERYDGMKTDIRIFGNGGFLGFTGWFAGDRGRYFAYVGSLSDCVMVTTASGRKYVMSCDRPDELVAEVNALVGGRPAAQEAAAAERERERRRRLCVKRSADGSWLAVSVPMGRAARRATAVWFGAWALFFGLSWALGVYGGHSPAGMAVDIGVAALFAAATLGCLWLSPRRVEVSADALTVRRRIGSKRIPLAHIINIRPYGGMCGDTWLMGTGGVMGFCGWHRGEGGKYFAYAADHLDTLLVRTARRTYAIGCGDTRALTEELARRLPGAADAAQGGADKV